MLGPAACMWRDKGDKPARARPQEAARETDMTGSRELAEYQARLSSAGITSDYRAVLVRGGARACPTQGDGIAHGAADTALR